MMFPSFSLLTNEPNTSRKISNANDDLIREDHLKESKSFDQGKSKILKVNLLIVNYPSDFDPDVSAVVDSVVLFRYLLVTLLLMDKE